MVATGRLRRLARRWPWWALFAVSAALHLWGLGDRTFHHDESIHAHGAWVLLETGAYRYDPTYHGPLLYLLTAASSALLGDSDATARLPVALAGLSLVGLAWMLRRPLGERAAWWTGLLATLSPTLLYYGRFLRMDVLELATASAAGVFAWRAARRDRASDWLWGGVFAGLALATKENAYVTVALVGATWAVLAAVDGVRERLPATVAWLWRRRWGVALAASAAVVVAVPLYTVGFTHPEDWWFPGRAVGYWWQQHEVQRVAGPPWFHLPRLALYEFLAVVAAVVWAVRRRRRMGAFERSLLLFAVASVAMYAYLGEKVPWLGVHQVWAFLPLAGLQLARTFGPRGRAWGRAIAAAALVATAAAAVSASFVTDEISPRRDRVEALVYVQTCPELQPVVAEGRRLAAAGEDPAVAVAGGAGWPLTWYWRDVPVWWSAPTAGMRPPLVVCDADREAEVRTMLGPGYETEVLPLRAWWLMEQRAPSFGELVRYVVTRRPWGVIGSSDIAVLRRTGSADEPAAAPTAAPVPTGLADALGVVSARRMGGGWLAEPRGVAVAPSGDVAVADVARSTVVLLAPDGTPRELEGSLDLREPEAVAWLPGGVLAIADTWAHRILAWRPESGGLRTLPEPPDGWYGPRGVAVARDGRLAVADTGHRRLVEVGPRPDGLAASVVPFSGELSEPVGVAWLGDDRVLVCDTGDRRLLVIAVADGRLVAEVPLPRAWPEFYSRPQVAVVGDDLWVATDPPQRALWVVRSGVATRVDLGDDGLAPAGVAFRDRTLWVTDLSGAVWAFELPGGGS